MDIEYYKNLFIQNGWERYLIPLYQWAIEEKDIEELITHIKEIEGEKIPLPNVKIIGEGEIKCDQKGCSVEAPKDTKVFVGAPKGFIPRYNGKRAWLERESKFDDEIKEC